MPLKELFPWLLVSTKEPSHKPLSSYNLLFIAATDMKSGPHCLCPYLSCVYGCSLLVRCLLAVGGEIYDRMLFVQRRVQS